MVSGRLGPGLLGGMPVETHEQTGCFGQQIAATAGYLRKFGHRGGRFRVGALAPGCMPPSRAGEVGHRQLVELGRGTAAADLRLRFARVAERGADHIFVL